MTPHSSDDDDRSYRTREEVELMKASDPLVLFRDQLLARGILTPSHDEELQDKARQMIDEAVAAASQAPYPPVSDAAFPVYAEDIRHG
jgi:2-oxoisovalerate dehydrogenase E1 component alpha subunit